MSQPPRLRLQSRAVDLFAMFPDLPWPRHSWRTFAEQVGERRRAIERVRREARETIARQRAAAARVAASVGNRAPRAQARRRGVR